MLLTVEHDDSRDTLFGGSDIDYRDTDASSQGKPTGAASADCVALSGAARGTLADATGAAAGDAACTGRLVPLTLRRRRKSMS